MSDFGLFKRWIIPSEKVSNNAKFSDYKHKVFPLQKAEIDEEVRIPAELKEFYIQIGYGFINQDSISFNRLFDPYTFKQINLREGFYEFDPELDSYEESYGGEKLLFFEVNEGIYIAIDKQDIEGKNSIYFFDKKLSDSLEDFLIQFDANPSLLRDFYSH
jgi:antitoxin YxxD